MNTRNHVGRETGQHLLGVASLINYTACSHPRKTAGEGQAAPIIVTGRRGKKKKYRNGRGGEGKRGKVPILSVRGRFEN